jgi:hypothetical protein
LRLLRNVIKWLPIFEIDGHNTLFYWTAANRSL